MSTNRLCLDDAARAGESAGLSAIPVSAPSASGEDEVIRSAARSEEGNPDGLQGFRILVVDDEPETRALVKVALEASGAQVTETDRVGSALALLTNDEAASRFDVLVSDIGMPERNGFELVTDLRAWERPRSLRIPALALTGHTSAEDRRRALECGFDRHLAKPVDVERLVESVRELAFRSHRTH